MNLPRIFVARLVLAVMQTQINLKSPMRLTRLLLPGMKEKGVSDAHRIFSLDVALRP